MSKANRFLGWVLCAVLSLVGAGQTVACAFHGYTPSQTLVDILLATEQIAIARLDPSNPDRYLLVETLAGPDVPDLPVKVDPGMRALLAEDPSSTVLLARDGAYGPWMEIAFLDDRYRDFIFRILRRQSELLLGNDRKRLRLFAELLNDPSPDIRRLALQELDRAPYGDLKSLRLPKVQTLRQDLGSSDDALLPIRVLLAGLSRDLSYSPVLSDGLDTAIRQDLPYLGAYATALVELEGQQAVELIFDRYLTSASLSPLAQERLLQAMFIQYKTAPRSTRQLISREVAALLRKSPELEEMAARQFGFQGRGIPLVQGMDGGSASASDVQARP